VDNKQKQLAAAMLNDYSEHLGCTSCNDWDFPEDWTHQEQVEFCKGYHEWNGDPEEFSENRLYLPDFAVAGYLAHLMIKELTE
jgi:hypothetical protein